MATINKRGNSWILCWSENGVQYRKSLGPISQRDAKTALHSKEVELRTGQKILPSALIFSRFTKEYLDWYATEYPSSYDRTEQIIRQHLNPAFEFHAIDQIWARDADAYKSKRLATGIKISTINKELRTLKAVLNKAVYWEYIKVNPLSNLKYSKELDSKPERYYTKEELDIIYQWSPYNWYWWKLMANTGIRRGEALQLKWQHVKDDLIHIISTNEERTKSGKWRNIPLNDGAKLALERFKRDKVDNYIFPRNHARSISRAFDRVLARAPIEEPKGSLHCLRHAFCSHLVIAGVPLRTVQKLAGHASFSTTEKYAHLSKDHLVDAVKLIEI